MAEGEGSAVVMFSGGQDSTACLAWALDRFERVETVGFDYRQRHRIELDCRPRILDRLRTAFPHWSGKLGADHMIDLGVMGEISESALTRETEIKLQADGLPSTFVPGRNLAFLTFAAMVAYRRGARHIVGGMCETDYSGYPDCRDDAMKAMQVALNIGMDRRFTLHTPLMWIDKAETWGLTRHLGGGELVEIVREESHSCYLGDRTTMHDWGRGCGTCPACELRRAGYEKYRAS